MPIISIIIIIMGPGNPMEILWKSYGNPMEILWKSYGNPMEIIWKVWGGDGRRSPRQAAARVNPWTRGNPYERDG